MAKKWEHQKSDKAADKQARHETAKQDRGSERSDLREKNRENREQGSSKSEYREQGGPNRELGTEGSDYREKIAANQERESDASDYMLQQEAARQAAAAAEAAKKSSCLPKLSMLLLPFVALGTYLLLKS
jgi:hypothetical protein